MIEKQLKISLWIKNCKSDYTEINRERINMKLKIEKIMCDR